MGNLRVFLRFIVIPSRSSSVGLVAKDEDLTFPDSFGIVLGWTRQGCGDTSSHDFVPPCHLHERYFMIGYDIIPILTHVIFVLDL
jgi:hypothetical protein